jgi:hypothetical protein
VTKKLKTAPSDKDYARVVAFISHEERSEDEKYLATLWLDKFISYRDAYPPRDDR